MRPCFRNAYFIYFSAHFLEMRKTEPKRADQGFKSAKRTEGNEYFQQMISHMIRVLSVSQTVHWLCFVWQTSAINTQTAELVACAGSEEEFVFIQAENGVCCVRRSCGSLGAAEDGEPTELKTHALFLTSLNSAHKPNRWYSALCLFCLVLLCSSYSQ